MNFPKLVQFSRKTRLITITLPTLEYALEPYTTMHLLWLERNLPKMSIWKMYKKCTIVKYDTYIFPVLSTKGAFTNNPLFKMLKRFSGLVPCHSNCLETVECPFPIETCGLSASAVI